jgi:hypothetical protein
MVKKMEKSEPTTNPAIQYINESERIEWVVFAPPSSEQEKQHKEHVETHSFENL